MEAALASSRSCFPGCVLEVVLGYEMLRNQGELHHAPAWARDVAPNP